MLHLLTHSQTALQVRVAMAKMSESIFNLSCTSGNRNSAARYLILHSPLPGAVLPTIVQALVESHTLSMSIQYYQQHFF